MEKVVDKKLGIYIPTYNRPEFLRKSLNSIITSIKYAKADGIPIFISDNSENNKTYLLVQQIKKIYPYIFYNKNEKNIGLAKNIFKVIKIGNTEFSWLIGDDDLLRKDAVSTVLKVIHKNLLNKQVNFIFVNYSYVDNNYSYILKEKIIDINEDIVIDINEFIQKHIWAIGFIGSCIIRRDCIISENDCIYCEYYFPHIGLILKCSVGRKVYMINDPIVLNRSENINSITWEKKSFEVYHGFEHTLLMFKDIYGESIINNALKNSKVLFKHKSVVWIASKRADGILNFKLWKENIWKNPNYTIGKKIISLPIAVLPVFLFKTLKFFVKTLPQNIKKKPLNLN